MRLANSAKPTQSEATLVSSSAGRALVTMSTSGEAIRRSTSTNAASSTTASTSRPIVRASPQPQEDAWASGSSRLTSAAASSTLPGTSIRPTARMAASRSTISTPTQASAPPATQIQNSTW